MKRILVVHTTNAVLNGITSVIMNYIRVSADKLEYDYIVAGRIDPDIHLEMLRYGKNFFIPPCSRVKHPIRYTLWLSKRMKERQYDAVHVHGNSGTMFFEMLAAKLSGIPVRICHSHSTSSKFKTAHYLLKPLMNALMTDALACSDLAGEWLFTKPYKLLPNGIDMSRFQFCEQKRNDMRKALDLQDCFVVGHVGYMDTEKNHVFLLDVFAELVRKRPESRLILIGEGRLRSQIEDRIKQLCICDKVLLLGRRSDMDQLYQCLDAFVLPSLFEGLPVSALEAQAAGLPCILSSVITRQVDISGAVQYLPIGELYINKWVDALCAIEESYYTRSVSQVHNSIFDIQNCSQKLLEVYGETKIC